MVQPIDEVTSPVDALGQSGGGGGVPGEVSWGDITGTLSNQTDLQSALSNKVNTSTLGAPNGVATLDADGQVKLEQLPVTVITEVFVVDSQADMLALEAQIGDVAIRTDLYKSFILKGSDPSDINDWSELLTPPNEVLSVNSKVGHVVINPDDLDDTASTNKFVTASDLNLLSTAIQPGDNISVLTNDTGYITGVSWGQITGTLENQLDLSSALNAKQNIITGAASTITDADLTSSMVLVSDASGKVAASTVTSSEVAHLSGVTSGIQGQINAKANSSVNLVAGTGLTGGGNLTEDRTFAVTYGTTEGTAAQGNDPRLSDAREWTATTVSQAEAEAGTATTRRAWTAQRVHQAIVAWWNSIGTTVGKALLNLANPGAVRFIRINANNTVTARSAADFRTDLGLGTAATATLATSTSDETIGRVLRVGDQDIGRRHKSIGALTNITPQWYSICTIASYSSKTTIKIYGGRFSSSGRGEYTVIAIGGQSNSDETKAVAYRLTSGDSPFVAYRIVGDTLYALGNSDASFAYIEAFSTSTLVTPTLTPTTDPGGTDCKVVSTFNTDSVIPVENGGTNANNAAAARANLGAASTAVATPSANGLMSSADKAKLDNIPSHIPYVKLSITAAGMVTVVGASTGITASVVSQTNESDLVMSFSFTSGHGLTQPISSANMYVDPENNGKYYMLPTSPANTDIEPVWTEGNFTMTNSYVEMSYFPLPVMSSDYSGYIFFK